MDEERTCPAIQLCIVWPDTLLVLVSIIVRKSENDSLRMVPALGGLEFHEVVVIFEIVLTINIPKHFPVTAPTAMMPLSFAAKHAG